MTYGEDERYLEDEELESLVSYIRILKDHR